MNRKTCTVGDLVEKVSKQFPFPAFRKAVRPDGMSLNIRFVSSGRVTLSSGITPFGLDRNALVADVMVEMEELEFFPASNEELADISTRISSYLEESKRAEEALKAGVDGHDVEAKGGMNPADVKAGDIYRYTKEGANELITVENIHRDDYPNLYFTVRFLKTGMRNRQQPTSFKPSRCQTNTLMERVFPLLFAMELRTTSLEI